MGSLDRGGRPADASQGSGAGIPPEDVQDLDDLVQAAFRAGLTMTQCAEMVPDAVRSRLLEGVRDVDVVVAGLRSLAFARPEDRGSVAGERVHASAGRGRSPVPSAGNRGHETPMGPEGRLTMDGVLVDNLVGIARTLAKGYEISDVLQDVTERVTAALGIAGAAVSILHEQQLSFVTAGSDALASLERVQERDQIGPCVEAASEGKPVVIDDLREQADRWPAYAAFADRAGVRAVADLPMRSDVGDPIGALSLYDGRPHSWSVEELDAARVLADVATSYVANASQLDRHRHTAEQLQRALDSRTVIEQAKGVIAAYRGVGVDEAFDVLRKHANDHHAGLHTTAEAVVNLGLRP